MLRAILSALFFFSIAALHTQAHAQGELAVQVDLIVASEDAGQMDPALVPLAGQLQARFPNFKSFRHHKQLSLNLSDGAPSTIDATPDLALTLELESMRDDTATLKVRLPGGDATISLPQSSMVFIAGPIALPNGVWIFAIARR